MLRNTIIYISLLIVCVGCVKHLDYIESINIRGQVLDRGSSNPIEAVNVILVARSLNNENKPEELITKSDNHGKIFYNFDFFWGENTTILNCNDNERTFKIILLKDLYIPVQLQYNIRGLAEKDGKKIIDINKIYLDKIK